MDEGIIALVTGGKNIGRHGKIVKIKHEAGPYPTVVTLENGKGEHFQTTLDYVFAIGTTRPLISMPEAD